MPEAVIHSLSLSVELLSHFLFWLAGVMAARTLEWPPLRSTAMAKLVMSSAAIPVQPHPASCLRTRTLYRHRCPVRGRSRAHGRGVEGLADRPRGDRSGACERPNRSCALIAAERNLSPREAEALALLAEGRSRTFIMEKLVISDATVKSHTNHIYQKLGVHSKQDLITLVRER